MTVIYCAFVYGLTVSQISAENNHQKLKDGTYPTWVSVYEVIGELP